MLTTAGKANAAVAYRLYDFEEGVAGNSTTTAQDAIPGALIVGTGGNAGLYWFEVPGGTTRPIPGGNLKASVDSVALSTPELNTTFLGYGSGMFVNVAGDSPVAGSTLAMGFDGATSFNDIEVGGGSRGVYADAAAYDAGVANVIGGTNVFESFTILTQAWIKPDSSAQGTHQTVFSAGQEQGAISISSNGFWQIDNIGGGFPDEGETTVPVAFDEWTHVAIMRGGNGALIFIDGVEIAGDLAPTPPNFFNTFSSDITLGSSNTGQNPFTGLVDNFMLSGFADGSFVPTNDIAFFNNVAPGDTDTDGDIDDFDLINAITSYTGSLDPGVGDKTFFDGDTDADGDVDDFDLINMIVGYTGSLGASAVPEPASLGLFLAAGVPLLRRRR